MIDFFEEDQEDFFDFDDEVIKEDVLKCDECGTQFTVPIGSEPSKCPGCKIEFI